MSRRGWTSLMVGLTVAALVLALAAPVGAVPPTGKKYTIDMFGAHINSPASSTTPSAKSRYSSELPCPE